jgi:hypothetical protein
MVMAAPRKHELVSMLGDRIHRVGLRALAFTDDGVNGPAGPPTTALGRYRRPKLRPALLLAFAIRTASTVTLAFDDSTHSK